MEKATKYEAVISNDSVVQVLMRCTGKIWKDNLLCSVSGKRISANPGVWRVTFEFQPIVANYVMYDESGKVIYSMCPYERMNFDHLIRDYHFKEVREPSS